MYFQLIWNVFGRGRGKREREREGKVEKER
jgi:hypothetical protein